MAATTNDDERGRDADSPSEIPPRGWKDIAWRVKDQLGRDNVSLIAAGLALYALLAMFPALTALVSIYGIFVPPQEAASQIEGLAGILPAEAAALFRKQVQELLSHQPEALGIGAIGGLLLALWSARKGMVALMAATNIAYSEREERGPVKQVLVSLAFTFGAVVGFITMLLIAVAAPIVLNVLGLGNFAETLLAGLRWVVLWLFAVLGLAIVYRFAPDRAAPKWRWVTWGSAIAATLWVIGSVLFAVYVRQFGYGDAYGSLGGVVVLLMWFYLSGYIVVLGAEINSELERQTRQDSTRGESEPMGRRGAYSADTLGEARS